MIKKVILVYLFALLGFATLKSQTIDDYNLLLVIGPAGEIWNAKTDLESMGHSVTLEHPENLIVGYDYSDFDVILFGRNSPEPPGIAEILTLNMNNQLGIVLLRGDSVISDIDMGTSVSYDDSNFRIENDSHYITQVFSGGILDLGFTYKSNLISINTGNTILGTVSSGNGSLVVNNTYRKVLCPYYGNSNGMPWTIDAEVLMDRIIAWAASNVALGTNDNTSSKKTKIYPNPSSGFIQMSGLDKLKNYRIYNDLGIEINNGTISNNEKINITYLTRGIYFLKFNDGKVFKFIKE